MRYAARVDANHSEIVAAFRALGYDVLDLSRVGSNCPDILLGRNNLNVLVEIKTEKGKLKPGQMEFYTKWKGHTAVVRSLDDVERLNKTIQQEAAMRMAGFDRLSRGGLTR